MPRAALAQWNPSKDALLAKLTEAGGALQTIIGDDKLRANDAATRTKIANAVAAINAILGDELADVKIEAAMATLNEAIALIEATPGANNAIVDQQRNERPPVMLRHLNFDRVNGAARPRQPIMLRHLNFDKANGFNTQKSRL